MMQGLSADQQRDAVTDVTQAQLMQRLRSCWRSATDAPTEEEQLRHYGFFTY